MSYYSLIFLIPWLVSDWLYGFKNSYLFNIEAGGVLWQKHWSVIHLISCILVNFSAPICAFFAWLHGIYSFLLGWKMHMSSPLFLLISTGWYTSTINNIICPYKRYWMSLLCVLLQITSSVVETTLKDWRVWIVAFFYRSNLFFMRRLLPFELPGLSAWLPAVDAIYDAANRGKMRDGRKRYKIDTHDTNYTLSLGSMSFVTNCSKKAYFLLGRL